MATFKFRLERVWKHRRRVVDEQSRDVARADRLVASLSRQIVELDGNIARHARTIEVNREREQTQRELIEGATWLNHLYDLHGELDGQLRAAVKDLERYRSRLTESWRDLEVLTLLKDRQEESWRMVQGQRERREMDEIGQVRAFRYRRAKGSH